MSERHHKRHGDGKTRSGRGIAPWPSGKSNRDGSSVGETRPLRGHDRCLDAFTIALNEADNGRGWFASTKSLQLTSLQLCAACRDVPTCHVQVKTGTPYRLSAGTDGTDPNGHYSGGKPAASTRVPALRPRGISWELPSSPKSLFESSSFFVERLKWFAFGDEFNNGVRALTFPKQLERVVFGRCFDQPVDGVSWSASLRHLTFGRNFNQPVHNLVWPARLLELTFGRNFNQPIHGVVWPATLLDLTFGHKFNWSVDNVVWPVSLEQLKFGRDFDRPIENVLWPTTLRRVVFNDNFDQAIDHVVWPAGLEEMVFGYHFDQPIHNVVWPASLRRLSFGACFDWPIEGVVWPASLQDLAFGFGFDHPINIIVWPTSLLHLTFGACFDQSLEEVVWPPLLQHLTLGFVFNHPLQGVKRWPSALSELTLLFFPSRHYTHSLCGIAWPAGLKRLTVGCRLGSEDFDVPAGVEICNYLHCTDCYSAGTSGTCWYHSRLIT